MGSLDKTERARRVEKALYEWLNETEQVEEQVCKMLDGDISKKDLISLNSRIKAKFRHLEDLIKVY